MGASGAGRGWDCRGGASGSASRELAASVVQCTQQAQQAAVAQRSMPGKLNTLEGSKPPSTGCTFFTALQCSEVGRTARRVGAEEERSRCRVQLAVPSQPQPQLLG